jgi:hypothetical protein
VERYKDREIEGRDGETEKKRDRADNKNPGQSRVAQLVSNDNRSKVLGSIKPMFTTYPLKSFVH